MATKKMAAHAAKSKQNRPSEGPAAALSAWRLWRKTSEATVAAWRGFQAAEAAAKAKGRSVPARVKEKWSIENQRWRDARMAIVLMGGDDPTTLAAKLHVAWTASFMGEFIGGNNIAADAIAGVMVAMLPNVHPEVVAGIQGAMLARRSGVVAAQPLRMGAV